ncbi:substrate-binding periplasmic protein [Shewanella sedimentimangrovi]|uniref:ABC transporter substrate-binding protein n=1 Tax=Shewanella sedimentimangrovi TaxID=2814293 RepID=A0ABX7QZI1_9GAMM|nr:ABC transporter substrate-binding protein [Shewanella sedimentimangrovi]QSX36959.1 ABC transporter substrate-binding protein [Shewanella sedimentimangrovi]
MRFIVCVCALLVTLSGHAATEVVIGSALNRPPYILEDSESGLELEIVRAALKASGFDARFKFYSQKRLQLYYMKDRIEAAMSVNAAAGLSGYPSDYYIYYQDVAVTLASRQLKFSELNQLQGYSLVAYEGAQYMLGEKFQRLSNKTIYREVEPQELQNRMLYLGRIDVAVADKYVFLANNKFVGPDIDSTQPLQFHEVFPRAPYLVMFHNSVVRDAFNRGLAEIRKNGEYDRLVKQFLN